jgi:membrane protease YdiL (CAAX protease family)
MMTIMELRKSGVFLIVLALLTASVAGLSTREAWAVVERFVVTFVFAAMGLFIADKSQIPGSLVVASEDSPSAIRDLFNFGVLPGLVLGLINYFFFFAYRYSPYVVPRIRNMNSVYDAFILSLDSALTEEVIFRLFFLSCFLYTLKQLYSRIKPLWPGAVKVIPVALALVLSSLLFALAHRSPYSFTAAFFGGMLLGAIYLKAGVEAGIAAHFAADFLFFSAAYLS